MKIRALVVDDERLARNRLSRLLTDLNVEVVAEGVNGEEAVSLLNQHSVEMLFIDINMPKKNGLEAVKEITRNMQQPPSIVFCTAYDEYALDAFRAEADAYLLKPISSEDLEKVIDKASALNQMQLKPIQERDKQNTNNVTKLKIVNQGSIENIELSDVDYFRSVDKHVFAEIKGRGEVLVDYSLKDLQSMFAPAFIRTHRSTLVNVANINKLTRDEFGKSFLSMSTNNQQLPVSRRHLSEVKKCF